jgi:hypothetical protein
MARILPDWITNSKWDAMCNANMEEPIPLEQADLTKPFVYDRRYGVFPVPRGSHQIAMSLLLAWEHGLKNGVLVAEKLKLSYSHGTADHFLKHTEGTAFLSSVGKSICAGSKANLNEKEKDYFGRITYLFD